MNVVEKLHEEGLNLSKMLKLMDKELGNIIDGGKVTDAIECYQSEIQDELRLCSHNRSTPEDIEKS